MTVETSKTNFDQLFLLDEKEKEYYFNTNEDKICYPTAFAAANISGKYDGGSCSWWLMEQDKTDRVPIIKKDGQKDKAFIHHIHMIRPTMWVKIQPDWDLRDFDEVELEEIIDDEDENLNQDDANQPSVKFIDGFDYYKGKYLYCGEVDKDGIPMGTAI